MTPYEWIDVIKQKTGLLTDYKVAQTLGISRASLSNYKTGKRQTFDESTSIKVAEVLGEKPEAVLLDQYAEQVKTPSAKAALHSLSRQLCILCKVATERITQRACVRFDSNQRLHLKA